MGFKVFHFIQTFTHPGGLFWFLGVLFSISEYQKYIPQTGECQGNLSVCRLKPQKSKNLL